MNKPWIKTPVCLLTDTGLSLTERVMYLYLFWRQGQNGDCYPSRERIAQDVGVSFIAVKRALRGLKRRGLIDVEHPTKQGRGQTNRYTVKGVTGAPLLDKEGGQNRPQKGVKARPLIKTSELEDVSSRNSLEKDSDGLTARQRYLKETRND